MVLVLLASTFEATVSVPFLKYDPLVIMDKYRTPKGQRSRSQLGAVFGIIVLP